MAGVMKSVNRAVVLGDGLNGWCGEVCTYMAVVLGDGLNGWCGEVCK